jgi:hypothetical protein
MIFFSADEAAIFELLDPASARRLIINRTGRAFVWDPIDSTTQVSLVAAQALVKQGIVDGKGRIAAEHVTLWRSGGGARVQARPVQQEAESAPESRFDRTLPLGQTRASLEAMG